MVALSDLSIFAKKKGKEAHLPVQSANKRVALRLEA